ncbi:MAG TPA: PhzF family phenazine biosynthesis protein [Candidatus Dormibacteraeota bacterium]
MPCSAQAARRARCASARAAGVLVAHACEDGSVTLDFPAATGGLGVLLCVVRDEASVRAANPDFAALAGVTRPDGIRGVILTAASSDTDGGVDYVSRCFYPADGIPEDAVTSSAHTALAPYWSRRLGRDPLVGLQASARMGVIRTSVHGERVHLTGHAVTLIEGTLHAGEREAVVTQDSVAALTAN